MKIPFDIQAILDKGIIEGELGLERALIADRKLKHLVKEYPIFKKERKKFRDIIEAYENTNWSKKSRISEARILESDTAVQLAEKERLFLSQRKVEIRKKLKAYDLTQAQMGALLGHKSKTYMSELVNGVSPFSLKDLIVINRILKIELSDLIPTILPHQVGLKIQIALSKLNNDKLSFEGDF